MTMARQALIIIALVFVSMVSLVMAEGPSPSPSHKAAAPDAHSPSTNAKAPTTSSSAPKVSPTPSDATPSASLSFSPTKSTSEASSPNSEDLNDSPSSSPVEGPAAGPMTDARSPIESTPADALAPPPKKNGAVSIELSSFVGVAAVMAIFFN